MDVDYTEIKSFLSIHHRLNALKGGVIFAQNASNMFFGVGGESLERFFTRLNLLTKLPIPKTRDRNDVALDLEAP